MIDDAKRALRSAAERGFVVEVAEASGLVSRRVSSTDDHDGNVQRDEIRSCSILSVITKDNVELAPKEKEEDCDGERTIHEEDTGNTGSLDSLSQV